MVRREERGDIEEVECPVAGEIRDRILVLVRDEEGTYIKEVEGAVAGEVGGAE